MTTDTVGMPVWLLASLLLIMIVGGAPVLSQPVTNCHVVDGNKIDCRAAVLGWLAIRNGLVIGTGVSWRLSGLTVWSCAGR